MRVTRIRAAVLGLTLAAGAIAAPAHSSESGYYSVPYSADLYHHAHGAPSSATITASFSMWHRDGFPTPRPAPVEYVAYPWSSTIYAVNFWGPERNEWTWTKLSYDQWGQVGRPTPQPAGWIPGTWYMTYTTSPEIFASLDGTVHKLTLAQWDAASWGYQPDNTPGWGVYKYPWHPAISVVDKWGIGRQLDYQAWKDSDFPTPLAVDRIGNERIWRYATSSEIHLESAIVGHITLTLEQWAAMGSPPPQILR